MRKRANIIVRIFYSVIFIAIIAYIGGMYYYPDVVANIIPYRFYTVLTDSMEPTIPTYSMVCSKEITQDETLKKGDIITFYADRFGKEIILTHRFNKIEESKTGETLYRTNPDGEEENLDIYETKRSDIIGTYVFHIPYVGKVLLFLKSPFGFIMYGEFIIVWLINVTLRSRWKEKEAIEEEVHRKYKKTLDHHARKHAFVLANIQFDEEDGALLVSGEIRNRNKFSVHYVVAEIDLYDEHHQLLKRERIYVVDRAYLMPRERRNFMFTLLEVEGYETCEIRIQRYKK